MILHTLALVALLASVPADVASEAFAMPRDAAPRLGMPGPPPAWVDGPAGDRWLAYESYCWSGPACASIVPPQNWLNANRMRVRAGTTVMFRLAFAPRRLTLSLGSATSRLRPRSRAPWRVRGRGGLVLLEAVDRQGRTVRYAVWIEVSPPRRSAGARARGHR